MSPRLCAILCLASLWLVILGYAISSNADALDDIHHYFEQADLIHQPEVVDCTLSGGTKTTCFRITAKPKPSNYEPGPWCPEFVTDSADAGGVWFDSGKVFDVDGAFIENLSTFYNDQNWQLFDPESGKLIVTDTVEKCAGAARPDVAPEYQQHCVECRLSYLDEDASVTYTIPLEPIGENGQYSTRRPGSGVAFNGVRLDGPAPVSDILGNYTLAPFDDCGGHINLHVGYHYHIGTDCLDETAKPSTHGSIVGIAMDGRLIHSRQLSDGSLPDDLDICGGHATDSLPYHYHLGEPGSNAILGCLSGEYGCVSEESGQACDASQTARRGKKRG